MIFNTSNNNLSLIGNSSTIIDPGEIAHFKFNEGSGNFTIDTIQGTNAQLMNGSVFWVDGKIGSGVGFKGVATSYIDCGSSNIYKPLNGLTISAWFNCPANISLNTIVACEYPDTTNRRGYWLGYDRRTSPPKYWWQLGVGSQTGVTDNVNLSGIVIDGQWNHACVSWNGSYMYAYANGSTLGSISTFAKGSQLFYSGTQGLNIGKEPGATSYMFSGLVDDVRIFNYAIDYTTIRTLYEGGIGTERDDLKFQFTNLQNNNGSFIFSGNSQINLNASNNQLTIQEV